ncbi:hypothetical protein GAY28_36655 [Azospirillum brasilense]|nr:hypothetical protein [Azospirillum brasilense]
MEAAYRALVDWIAAKQPTSAGVYPATDGVPDAVTLKCEAACVLNAARFMREQHTDLPATADMLDRVAGILYAVAACAVALTPEWKDRHPNLTVFLNRLWRGAKSMNLSAEDDFRELYDAALDGKLEAGHLARLAVDEVRNSTDDPVDGLTVLFNALLADAALTPQPDPLGKVRQAIADYHYALDTRQHGGTAAHQAIDAIKAHLGITWEPGAEKARRSSTSTPDVPVAVAPPEPVPVRCGVCGWLGDATELGEEGECGGDENCTGRPTEITDPAEMLEAWLDREGLICGDALVVSGLIEQKPATAEEAAQLDIEEGDTVWDVTAKGNALLDARRSSAPSAGEA